MKLIGRLIVLIAAVAILTKLAAIYDIRALEVSWFARLDAQGDMMGWNWRVGILAFGSALLLLGRFRERGGE